MTPAREAIVNWVIVGIVALGGVLTLYAIAVPVWAWWGGR